MSKPVLKPGDIYFEPGSSLTKQSFKDECDINQIIDRARQGQGITHVNERVAQYGDFTRVPDFRAAQDLVIRANAMFMELDAHVRERFGNDPARLMDFMQDPRNYDEAVRLGILVPKVQDTPAESQDRGVPDDSGEPVEPLNADVSGAKAPRPAKGKGK